MSTLLFDHPKIRLSLQPLTYTRPVADLRLGITTIAEKWDCDLGHKTSFLPEEYLQSKYIPDLEEENLFINGALCPDVQLVEEIQQLSEGEGLKQDGILLAYRSDSIRSVANLVAMTDACQEYSKAVTLIKFNWDLFITNGEQIKKDFERVTKGRVSNPVTDPFTVVYNPENLFIEDGVTIKAAIINAEQGPVYLGKNAEVQEGTIIQGPFAMGENSQLRLGGKMRLNTTIGPNCKVGGEVGNVIFQSDSNKAHEGFLGNSVIGAWCNLGADTNNSNLKNNYANVRCWNYQENQFIDSGLQFCGVVMGDHSKCSINTMFNTGTVVGVCANVFGSGFPKKFVPSFIWGGTEVNQEYDFEKACDTMSKVMARRTTSFDAIEKELFQKVFELSMNYRKTALD